MLDASGFVSFWVGCYILQTMLKAYIWRLYTIDIFNLEERIKNCKDLSYITPIKIILSSFSYFK